MIDELEPTQPLDTLKFLIEIEKNLIALNDKYDVLERCIQTMHENFKILLPNLRYLVENLDGIIAYVSDNLSKKVEELIPLKEKLEQASKKKQYNKYSI